MTTGSDAGPLAGRLVRASSGYTLAPVAALPAAVRSTLGRLGVDVESASGVLLADQASGLPGKLLDDGALKLWSDFIGPREVEQESNERILGLVLDAVLEVQTDDGYLGGPAAFATLAMPNVPMGITRLGKLSRSALEYLARLQMGDEDVATARLYRYNRIPLSRHWERAFPGRLAVMSLFPQQVMARHWRGPLEASRYWLSWSARKPPAGRQKLPYKVYVSPGPEELPEALPRIVEALTSSGAVRFKVAPDAAGLLRPDKIVAYLPDAASTSRVARALGEALDGFRPQGVPFTAELSEGGIVSWGGDPPPNDAPVGRRSESWRISVCRRLAESVLAAQRAGLAAGPAVEFALTRLSLDGVHIPEFAPAGLQTPATFSTVLVR